VRVDEGERVLGNERKRCTGGWGWSLPIYREAEGAEKAVGGW
jgi:hypothetical protein